MPTDKSMQSGLSETNVLRSVIYRLLSEIFSRELTAQRLGELVEAASKGGLPFKQDPALEPLFDKLASLGGDRERTAKDLAGAFSFLFLGVGGPRSAPPYESVFVSEHGRTNQGPAASMARELASLDLHIRKELPEPEDHVAIELAAAAAMIETGVTKERQHTFLNEHLNVWLGDFAVACGRSDRSGFYAAAARAASEFVAADVRKLAETVANPVTQMESNNV